MKSCDSESVCPCGRLDARATPLLYSNCCGRYLEADEAAPDAESLMRSRYSAFCLERSTYLLATWHESTQPTDLSFNVGVKWLGLEVRRHQSLDAHHAEVEFVARHKPLRGAAVRLHETSSFVCENGRWYYVDGNVG